MIVIDNFLSDHNFSLLQNNIQAELTSKDRQIDGCDLREEYDHIGLDNSNFFMLKKESRTLLVKELVSRNYFHPEVLDDMEVMLRYHVTEYPYSALWHKDRMSDWESDKIDYIGMTMFLNDWNSDDGGLYIYKEHRDSTEGNFVMPRKNRVIYNPKDYYHAVTQITKQGVKRYSLQMFISSKYAI
jgi:hypothetical protein